MAETPPPPSSDLLSVVGTRYEDLEPIGERLLVYLREVLVRDRGKDGDEIDRNFLRAIVSPEFMPVFGYASVSSDQNYVDFCNIPTEQAILIDPHELGRIAQYFAFLFGEMARGNAPCDRMANEIAERLCILVHGIRAAIERAKERALDKKENDI